MPYVPLVSSSVPSRHSIIIAPPYRDSATTSLSSSLCHSFRAVSYTSSSHAPALLRAASQYLPLSPPPTPPAYRFSPSCRDTHTGTLPSKAYTPSIPK